MRAKFITICTKEKLKEICKDYCDWGDDEARDGPGDFGSHTYLTVTQCTVDKL